MKPSFTNELTSCTWDRLALLRWTVTSTSALMITSPETVSTTGSTLGRAQTSRLSSKMTSQALVPTVAGSVTYTCERSNLIHSAEV